MPPKGPQDLTDLSVLLAARMVKLAGLAKDDDEAEAKVRAVLDSGAGLEVFRKCIEQQGGDARVIDDYQRFPIPPWGANFATSTGGFIASLDAEKIGVAAMRLGAGRAKAEDRVDHAVGITVLVKPGDFVNPRDPLFTIHYRDEVTCSEATSLLGESVIFSDAPPRPQPLVLEELG